MSTILRRSGVSLIVAIIRSILPLLQELDAVGRDDRHELELDAEALGDVGGEIGLEADDLARGIEKAERPVVGLGAHDQRALLLDVVEHVGASLQ